MAGRVEASARSSVTARNASATSSDLATSRSATLPEPAAVYSCQSGSSCPSCLGATDASASGTMAGRPCLTAAYPPFTARPDAPPLSETSASSPWTASARKAGRLASSSRDSDSAATTFRVLRIVISMDEQPQLYASLSGSRGLWLPRQQLHHQPFTIGEHRALLIDQFRADESFATFDSFDSPAHGQRGLQRS